MDRIVRLVQAFGLERVHEPYIEHIEGPMIPAEESFAASRKRPEYEKFTRVAAIRGARPSLSHQVATD